MYLNYQKSVFRIKGKKFFMDEELDRKQNKLQQCKKFIAKSVLIL